MASNINLHGAKVEMIVMYKECMHNHAAKTTGAMGAILDGCGLFEPNGPNGTPEAMVCAACGCHRNFHRRVEVELPLCYITQTGQTSASQQQTTPVHVPNPIRTPVIRGPAPHLRVQQQRFTNSAATIGSIPPIGRQEMNQTQGVQNWSDSLPNSLFRFAVGEGSGWQMMGTERRRRMTQQQSERLRVIAESNNWKMFQEYSKEEVNQICSEMGINRLVMKSWIFGHRRRQAANNAAN